MNASRGSRWFGVAVGAGLLLAAGCTSRADDPEPWPAGEFRLVSFDSCEQVEDELRAAASEHVGPWGFEIGGAELFARNGADDAAEGAAAAPEAAVAPDPAPQEYSGTNVHEAGVDEPDLVKTDGQRIVVVSNGVLRVVDAQRQVETGRLDLRTPTSDIVDGGWWQPAELLLHGDRALVLMREGWWDGLPEPGFRSDPDVASQPGVAVDPAAPSGSPVPAPIVGPRLLLVELSGAPRVLSEYTIDGSLVDARAVGQTARVVVRSGPRLAFPELDESLGELERTAANRKAVDAAPLTNWLPRYQVSAGDETDTGQVDCTAVSRPESYTGTSMLTVLTFDLASPALGDGIPVSVVADGDTVYSNGPSLYIASDQRWRGAEAAEQTEVYKFDTAEPGRPRYAAAGTVDGWVINQYAMSEWEGHLRVATTTTTEGESESTVYVLAQRDGELVETGSVGGLGKTERIHSVRFTGPIGYVVTFRETDPLYTLDLRDPAAPAVLGELKITGYSAYLHPLGDGRLIGVGQEADLEGVIQGTQVSLFDVSDLADPSLLGQHHVRYGHSEAEFDPHAFLWWPAERLLVIPITNYNDGDSGALLLRVDDESLTEVTTTSHPGGGQIIRSLVVGDTLWTVSDQGLQANALSTLTQTAWLPLT